MDMLLSRALCALLLTEAIGYALWRFWEELRKDMENAPPLSVSGTVDEIIFTNEANGYTVLRLETQDGQGVTVTGCIPFAAPGEQLTAVGSWVSHASYGQQFQADYAERRLPRGAEAVYEYLASRVVKGIGPATASVLVSAFGERTLDVIEREPEKLAQLKGITPKKAREMSENLRRQLGLRHLVEFLSAHALRPQYAVRLYRAYQDRALELVQENPYLLCASHIGAPFSEADRLALDLGMEGDSAERVAAAVLFELQYNTGNGHVFIPREKLIEATAQLLDLEAEPVEEGLDVLLDSGEVVCETVAERRACYLASLYEAERYCAERIGRMAESKPAQAADFSALLADLEARQGITYAPMQRKTLELAARNRLLLLTGGPGTGKTTTVRAIIAMFERQGLKVSLAAPTGRAAKRLGELTGREAQTIHRLLEAGYAEDGFDLVFKRDEDQPLKCDALIVDECSMIDITLLRALLAALPADCRLVFVGDADQLPSVGPGNVFLDLLRSNRLAVARLTEIFRQTADSRIVRYAHEINDGKHPNIAENKGDFFFLRRLNQDAAVELVVQLCAKRLPQNMGIRPEEIQVLTPTRKTEAGTAALNQRLQAALNPPSPEKKERKYGKITFREGDRVMQIRNNYDIMWRKTEGFGLGTGVFNGDVGKILSIDLAEEIMTIAFDDKTVEYSFDLLGQLELAYAMTVHKSQGSEYRAVILAACHANPYLLTRSILYTAVTRAKELLILVGDPNVVLQMVENNRQSRRYSGLKLRLAMD